jgi:hypothetical protein
VNGFTIVAEVEKDGKVEAEVCISFKGRPCWNEVLKGYPLKTNSDKEMESHDVFEYLFGPNYSPTYINACAARVSIALLKANMTIGQRIEIINVVDRKTVLPANTTEITHGTLRGKRVILGASTMYGWLKRIWGNPEYGVTQPQTTERIRNQFEGKTGIYIMLPSSPRNFGGATGHCTLWTGEGVIGSDHAASAFQVYLWELK